MAPSTTSFYRQVAATGATYLGLLVVVLDSLAEDLRLAGVACSTGDITRRCASSNHALLLLGHLESWAADVGDPALASSLNTFYAFLRSSILALQTGTTDQPFFDLAMHVTQLRAAWQRKETDLLQAHTARMPTPPESLANPEAPRISRWLA